MHHFIYPSQDTFITDTLTLSTLNFGLNEILRVGTKNTMQSVVYPTTSYPISSSVSNLCVINFSGSVINASLYGTASFAQGNVSSSGVENFASAFYIGNLTGSFISASNVTSSRFTGSLSGFTGSFTGIFNGNVSGSIQSDFLSFFNGSIYGFTGKFTNATIVGADILNQQHYVTSTVINRNRALVQFDISTISQSIVSGDINNPQFTLKLKVSKAEELPITYTLSIYPIAESWVMGDGYYFDGGSTVGASWVYRDRENGTPWTITGSSYITTISASQFFNYQVGDIDIDVTNIVDAWLNQSIPNNGFLILSNDEFNPTGSGMSLHFFSEDTNTIYIPTLDVGWNDVSYVTGSVSTGSVSIITNSPGLSASISDNPTIINNSINGNVFGVMNVQFNQIGSGSGTVNLMGTSGNVDGIPIYGSISGSRQLIEYTSSIMLPGLEFAPGVWAPGPTDINDFIANFGFFPFSTTTTIFTIPITASLILGTLLDGQFSGSTLTASIESNVQIQGNISGSWNTSQLLSGTISASYPFLNYPNLVAYIQGTYVYGTAYGALTQFNPNVGTGIFIGTMVAGPNIGSYLTLPFTGSLLTSSISTTGSVTFTSRSLDALNVSTPFVTIVKIPPTVKTNQIIRVGVFGRQEFPLKNFQRMTQFSQFLTPAYLPTSSFYAIKDNETEEIVLDFDNYTQISCDLNGNYFMLDTSGLPEERYFKILIKVEQSGSVYIVDNNDIFKVVR